MINGLLCRHDYNYLKYIIIYFIMLCIKLKYNITIRFKMILNLKYSVNLAVNEQHKL